MESKRLTRIACLFLAFSMLSIFVMRSSALTWHGGKALVLYSDSQAAWDGWVQYDYKISPGWDYLRAEFPNQGWTVDYATHVTAALLQDYDSLWVLTPCEDIPDTEATDIIAWVKEGGQLMITENEGWTYADEITSTFGITWSGWLGGPWDMDTFDYTEPLTTTPYTLNLVEGYSANKLAVSSPATAIGWDDATKTTVCLAIAEGGPVEQGMVVALCDDAPFDDTHFNNVDNEELMDNILARFWDHSYTPIPEFEVSAALMVSVVLAGYLLSKKFSIPKPRY